MMPTKISLKIDGHLYAQISTMAESLNRSAEDVVAEAIMEKIQRQSEDDQARLRQYRAALKQFERDRLGVPYEDVSDYLNSIFDEKPLPLPECRKL